MTFNELRAGDEQMESENEDEPDPEEEKRREAKLRQEAIVTQLEEELGDRWREKTTEVFQFRALLSSRCNVYVHGPNGAGKTSFVLDCIKVQSTIDSAFLVNVDCIEFYSERLLAVCISQHLITLLTKAAKKISGKGNVLTNQQARSFGNFRVCKTVDQLHDNLRSLQNLVEKTKR